MPIARYWVSYMELRIHSIREIHADEVPAFQDLLSNRKKTRCHRAVRAIKKTGLRHAAEYTKINTSAIGVIAYSQYSGLIILLSPVRST